MKFFKRTVTLRDVGLRVTWAASHKCDTSNTAKIKQVL